MKLVTRFRCVVCGKLTAGKQPYGENTVIMPRTHKVNGVICKGSWREADMVDVDEHGKDRDKNGILYGVYLAKRDIFA